MADLTGKEASQSVIVSGANPSTGVETNYLDVDSTGSIAARIKGGTDGTIIGNSGDRIKVESSQAASEKATFVLFAQGIAIGNNKSMVSLLNATGSGVVIRVTAIKILNTQTTSVTGVVADFRLFRMTGHSVGTLITPQTYDTNDTIDADITIRTGATIAGEAASPLNRWLKSSDEWGVGVLDTEGLDQAIDQVLPLYQRYDSIEKNITLRPGQGFTIKQVVNSTAGTFDILVTFTQELE